MTLVALPGNFSNPLFKGQESFGLGHLKNLNAKKFAKIMHLLIYPSRLNGHWKWFPAPPTPFIPSTQFLEAINMWKVRRLRTKRYSCVLEIQLDDKGNIFLKIYFRGYRVILKIYHFNVFSRAVQTIWPPSRAQTLEAGIIRACIRSVRTTSFSIRAL